MPKVIPEYKEIAKTKIVEAARGVFQEKGFRQATMEEVASRLGISKAAVYTYFKDKENLFRATYESSPRVLAEIFLSLARDSDPRRSFELFFEKMLSQGQFEKGSALGFEVLSEASRNPDLRKVLKGTYDQYLEAVEQCLTTSAVEKRLRTPQVAKALIALWNGMETLMAVGYPVSEVKESWNESLRLLFKP